MTNQQSQAETLNDLIQINRDRVKGYDHAIEDVTEGNGATSTVTFSQYKSDSERFIQELSSHVRSLGGEPATETTIGGMIHRTWMDIKTSLSSHEKESALNSCVYGDEAAIKAYESALESTDPALPADVNMVLSRQLASIRSAHNANKMHAQTLENIHS